MDDNDGNTVAETEFAGDRQVMAEVMGQRLDGFEPLNMMNVDMTADSQMMQARWILQWARATALLTNGAGALQWSSESPLLAAPTLHLVKLVKESTDELLDRRREEVHTSCGVPIDKQLALGLAICDALGREVLACEARNIGKAAAGLLPAAKKKDELLKGNAAAKRTRARKAAAAADKLENLDATIAGIDAERDVQRAALWGTPVSLPIPTAPLVPTRERQPPPPKAMPPKVDELAAARAALTAAFAAHAHAQRDDRDAQRALARLQPPKFAGKQEIHVAEMSDADCSAAERKARQTEGALRLAELDVKSAEQSLDLEFELAEMNKKAVAERAARQRAREAEREACVAERQAAEAVSAQAKERSRMLAARVASLRFQFCCLRWRAVAKKACAWAAIDELEAEMVRDATRVRLLADAEKMWGSCAREKENAPPKVFSLVGKSAAEVGAMASQVSQVTTSVEERAALNKLARAEL